MAKIRTLKREISLLRKTELRIIKKEKQRAIIPMFVCYESKVKFGLDRLSSLINFTKLKIKLKSIINQKT
ncbi:hypothetical protein [Flavobacterium sp.]|uniref:hypothetical protein n=1 Tax=Flavobacterium sp. TaxID=239 RepID=UPI0040474E4E